LPWRRLDSQMSKSTLVLGENGETN